MNNEKEVLRHKKVMDSIKNAKSKEELPSVSYSTIANYLASNVYFDNNHISQSLFKPVVDMIVTYNGLFMPQVKEVFIRVLKENYPDKKEEEYLEKFNIVAWGPRIINLLIEIGERNVKLQQFQDKDDLDNHNFIMKGINNAFEVKDLPKVFISDLSKRIQRDFNDNDFIKNIKVSSIKNIVDAYMEGKSIKEIDSLIYNFCDKQSLEKDSRKLMYSQIRSNILNDKNINYIVSEIKARDDRVLKIYKMDHEEVMERIKDASRISQLPPNLTESRLTSYLSGNSIIFENGDKISTLDLKNVTKLLLDGKKWEDKEIREELHKLCSKYYNKDLGYNANALVDVSFKLLYDKFSVLPKVYYLVDEINACKKRQKEFINNNSSNVNIYFIPNNKGPIDGGRFYNCYINRVDNLDLGELLPLDLDEIVPPGMDIDSVEWFIQEKYDKTFKKAGGIILNKDETIGNVNEFRTNEDSSTVKNYEELSSLYDRVNELFSERNKEQEQFLKSLSLFLKSQNEKDRELDELKNRIDSLNSDVKKRKKGK